MKKIEELLNLDLGRKFDTPKKLNRSQSAIPAPTIEQLEGGEFTAEMIADLAKSFPIFYYRTCITIHGDWREISRTRCLPNIPKSNHAGRLVTASRYLTTTRRGDKRKLKMNEVKHTPGPWETDFFDRQIWVLDSKNRYLAEIVIKDDEGKFIKSARQREANAELMAAAPGMAEKIKALEFELAGAYKNWHKDNDIKTELLNVLRDIIQDQHSVIATKKLANALRVIDKTRITK